MNGTVTTTLCWQCSKEYFASHTRCPYCAATNANHDPAQAMREAGEAAEFAEIDEADRRFPKE